MSTPVRFLALGLSLLGWQLARHLEGGALSSHIRAGLSAGSFCLLATTIPIIALPRDMLVRQRLEQEEMLHLLGREMYRAGEPGIR